MLCYHPWRLTAILLSLLAVAGGCVGGGGVHASGDFARSVDIGDGRALYLECRGVGAPTVILESGYHDSSDPWRLTDAAPPAATTPVLQGIAERQRVCAYDRPGTLRYDGESGRITERSTPVAMPRTALDVVRDLHRLLAAAGEAGPYVLVAHSLGGIFARLYAQTYPGEVLGIVFVDSFPVELPQLFGAQWPAYRAVLDGAGALASPDYERIDVDASVAQVRQTRPLRPMPLAVLSKTEPFGGLPDNPVGFTAADLERFWHEGEQYLVALAPQTPHLFATGSDHYVQVHRPDLVIAATRLVTARAAAND